MTKTNLPQQKLPSVWCASHVKSSFVEAQTPRARNWAFPCSCPLEWPVRGARVRGVHPRVWQGDTPAGVQVRALTYPIRGEICFSTLSWGHFWPLEIFYSVSLRVMFSERKGAGERRNTAEHSLRILCVLHVCSFNLVMWAGSLPFFTCGN